MNRATIQIIEQGFTITTSKGTKEIEWNDINEIATYNVDAYTHQVVCIGFRQAPGRPWTEVSEEDTGIVELATAVANTFKEVPSNWYEQVTTPPVNPNYVTIWRRE